MRRRTPQPPCVWRKKAVYLRRYLVKQRQQPPRHEDTKKRELKYLPAALLLLLLAASASAQEFYVSLSGNDAWPGTALQPWRTIQKAATSAAPGSTVLISGGVYTEKVTVNVSGDSVNGFISFRPLTSDSVILDGTGLSGENMIWIQGRSYLRLEGLFIRNNTGLTDGSGVRIEGACRHIELSRLTISRMYGSNAMGITCYGTDPVIPISDLVIDSTTIFDCQAAPSEALTVNGNIDGFAVTNCVVHDINNIGIVCIGGEGVCPTNALDRARHGVCRGNLIYRARSSYGGGYAAGLYVDGGRSIVLENNILCENDLGIEVGCENHGETAESVVVRNNLVFNNDKRGISFGGYNYPSTGRVRACTFTNNTLFRNDVLATGDGDFVVEYALDCTVRNNIVVAGPQNILLSSNVGSSAGNTFDDNQWYAPAGPSGALFAWGGETYTGFAAYRAATGQDAASSFGDPEFVLPTLPAPDLHIQAGSPAVDAGWSGFVPAPGETDIDREPRVIGGRVDRGADELSLVPAAPVLLAPADEATGVEPDIVFHWMPLNPASGYRLQVATDSLFVDMVFEDSVAGVSAVSSSPLPSATRLYWRVSGYHVAGAGPWSDVWSFMTTAFQLRGMNVTPGWNLLSLPLTTFNGSVTSLFPQAVSSAFQFDPVAGYGRSDTMEGGRGYWLKFSGVDSVTLAGTTVNADTITINAGWNLVGTTSVSLDTFQVRFEPPWIRSSLYFGYYWGYYAAGTLDPGNAYWLKASSPGLMILGPTPVSSQRRSR
jgi:hypothetical protein